MRRATFTIALFASLLLAAAGCSRSRKGGKESTGVASLSGALRAWKEAGLEPTGFGDVDGSKLGGGKCKAGTIDGLDTTICEYADPAQAKKQEEAGLALVGDTTGASIAQGKLLLVVADRKSADPNGRRINEITRTFRHLR